MSLFRNRNKTIEDGLRKQLGDLEYKPSDSLWDRIGGELKEDGFEQKVQTKVDEFELMPYPETWGRIEAELPEERVARPLFNRWGYAALLLLFMTGVYAGYLWRNPGQPETTVLNEKAVTPQVSTPSPSKPVESRISIAPKNKISVASSGKTRQAKTIDVTTGSISKQAQQVSKSSGSASSKPVIHTKPKTSSEGTVTKTSVKIASAVVAQNAIAKDKSATVSETKTAQSNDQRTESSAPATIESKPALAATVVKEVPVTIPEATTEPVVPAVSTAQVANGNNNTTTDSLKTVVAQPAVATVPLLLTPTGDISGEELSRYSITAMAGVQYCFTHLSAPSSSNLDFSKNIALRESIEKPSLDWSGSFMIDYAINNQWRVSVGIGMLNFSQQFYYNITAPSSPPSSSEPGASTINTNDSIVTGNNYSTRIKYSWTEIPVLVTYSFNHKNKFGFELQGGVTYAMISSVDAGMVSYDNIGVLVLKDKNAFPQIKNSVFVQLNPALTYQVNNQITLSVLPTFKYSLNSMIKNDNWVQQYPYFFGASVSLRRRF